MDHELKQRLIGAVVVTALAAIFIPMLFDDPVDTSGKAVTELAIPQAPMDSTSESAQNLPANKEQVLNKPDTELSVSEDEDIDQSEKVADSQATKAPVSGQTEQPVMEADSDEPTEDGLANKEAEQKLQPEPGASSISGPTSADDAHQNAAKTVVEPKQSKPLPEVAPKKQVVSEKSKTKPASLSEKPKTAAKTQKETQQKSNAKLVRYSLQAGSFGKKENAQALVEKLRKQGLPATIVAKGDLYRVKVGPALDKKKAAEMRAKLDKQNINSLLISE